MKKLFTEIKLLIREYIDCVFMKWGYLPMRAVRQSSIIAQKYDIQRIRYSCAIHKYEMANSYLSPDEIKHTLRGQVVSKIFDTAEHFIEFSEVDYGYQKSLEATLYVCKKK